MQNREDRKIEQGEIEDNIRNNKIKCEQCGHDKFMVNNWPIEVTLQIDKPDEGQILATEVDPQLMPDQTSNVVCSKCNKSCPHEPTSWEQT